MDKIASPPLQAATADPKPLFFNCWNQNVVCSFCAVDGSEWFAAFGKHSKHFPIYGASWENLMLYNKTTQTGYAVTQDVLTSLRFHWQGSLFRLEYEGRVSVYGYHNVLPSSTVWLRIQLAFEALPLKSEHVFLKRLAPTPNRFVPGAIFRNQLLLGYPSCPDFVEIENDNVVIPRVMLKGHLENGVSTLINGRIWTIPYHYLGLLRDEESKNLSFYYKWNIRPLKPGNAFEKAVCAILKGLAKERVVLRRGTEIQTWDYRPDGIFEHTESPDELFSVPFQLGEFVLTRRFVRVRSFDKNQNWYGILEDFSLPEFDGGR